MRVLFTHSWFLRFDPKQWRQMQPYAPLGTLYAAALLREHGFRVDLHDVMFSSNPSEISGPLTTFSPQVVVIYDDGFNYLTKMCLTNMREAAFEMIHYAKDSGCTVIVCASDAADHFEKYLQQGADVVIIGEGEQTLLELVSAIKHQSANYRQIAGLVYKGEDGALLKTLPRKVMHDLDSLPLPAWDLVNMEHYRSAWLQSTGYFSINLSSTRGCPFKCNWCAKPIYGNRYNVRSPQRVVEELSMLKDKYQFDHVWFCDDIFGLRPGWIKEFSSLVKQKGLKFRFRIQSRADLLLKDDQVSALAEAGCQTVWIGAESGSQKILDAMDKGITIDEITTATAQLKKHSIHVAWFIQFGYLGETREDIESTLRLLQANMPDDIGISVSYPLPGTKFYEKVGQQLRNKSNWTDSDDLALMFRNNFGAAYYRRLHKYVHAYYRRLKTSAAQNSLRNFLKFPYYAVQERWHRSLLNKLANDR